jgi:hypothetical protein
MKANCIIPILMATALSAGVVGCKNETNPRDEKAVGARGDAVTEATDAVKRSVASAKEAGAKAVTDLKTAGAQAVTAVSDKAKEIAAPANAKAQELIESAKHLFSEGKLADALAKLKETSGAAPSPEQQSVVDRLKAQVEKAMTATKQSVLDATRSATNAVSNFFQK